MGKQTVLIAGATGNIGFAAAVALAKRGVHVVLLGRHADKLRAKAQLLWAHVSAADDQLLEAAVESLVVDFADTQSVRRAAAEALQRFATIDGIVHSAGVFRQDGPRVLANGHEAMFAANVLGPFVFTEVLFERLAECGGCRRAAGGFVHAASESRVVKRNDIPSQQAGNKARPTDA